MKLPTLKEVLESALEESFLIELCSFSEDSGAVGTISFPKGEHASLKKRLDSDKPVYTTRIKAEKEKYHVGQLLRSPFGTLKVMQIKQVKGKHPFEAELTKKQKEVLAGEDAALIKLKKSSKNEA